MQNYFYPALSRSGRTLILVSHVALTHSRLHDVEELLSLAELRIFGYTTFDGAATFCREAWRSSLEEIETVSIFPTLTTSIGG